MPRNVAIFDCDEFYSQLIAKKLHNASCRVKTNDFSVTNSLQEFLVQNPITEVVIADLGTLLPNNGIASFGSLRERHIQVLPIVVTTSHRSDYHQIVRSELGCECFHKDSVELILQYILDLQDHKQPTKVPDLTPMDRTIISLIHEGKTSKQIAEVIYRSPKTIPGMKRRIAEKLGIKNSNHQLQRFAMEYSLWVNATLNE